MKKSTILQLDHLNHQFYQKTARDFAASRWQAWPGWKQLLPDFEQKVKESTPINVLDVGCGGGRLARFLHNNLIETSKGGLAELDSVSSNNGTHNYLGVDRSLELLDISTKLAPKKSTSWQASFAQMDLVRSLVHDTLIADLQNISSNQPDIICLFAVTHHIPSFKLRQRLITNLADWLAPNGLLMVSSWQFLNSHKQRDRLIDPISVGLDPTDWEENDYIMDWRAGAEITYRYCHYMNNDEEVAILKTIDLQVINEFFADGVTRNMNHYLVLQKKLF